MTIKIDLSFLKGQFVVTLSSTTMYTHTISNIKLLNREINFSLDVV